MIIYIWICVSNIRNLKPWRIICCGVFTLIMFRLAHGGVGKRSLNKGYSYCTCIQSLQLACSLNLEGSQSYSLDFLWFHLFYNRYRVGMPAKSNIHGVGAIRKMHTVYRVMFSSLSANFSSSRNVLV